MNSLVERLSKLKCVKLTQITDSDGVLDDAGSASIVIIFSDGTRLRADYWRLIKKGKAHFSNFDHQQQYGMPERINAKKDLSEELSNKEVVSAEIDKETGDLIFKLTDNLKLEVLNFTGYEVWEMTFPDGSGEYSNYAK